MPNGETHGDFRLMTEDGAVMATGTCHEGDVLTPIVGLPIYSVDHATLHAINGMDAAWRVAWAPFDT